MAGRRTRMDATDGGAASGVDPGRAEAAAVALVGFMGAGKSAVGRELATALGVPFVDADDLIVAKAGPIAEIFAERGEAGFRALEADIVTAALTAAGERPCVLALGGGAVLSDAVRRALRSVTHVILLTAPPEELWARVAGEAPGFRPLAGDEESFRALLAAREPLYREVATEVVETNSRSAAEVAAGVVARISTGGRPTGQGRSKGGDR